MSGSEGIFVARCFLRQRSEDRIEQVRFFQGSMEESFNTNTLAPTSGVAIGSPKGAPAGGFFPEDAFSSSNQTTEKPKTHDDASQARISPQGGPAPVLPSIAGIHAQSRTSRGEIERSQS